MIDRLNRWLGENLCWLYLVAVAATAYEVVMRYLFNAPTDWAFELTVLLCGICYLLAGGYVTQKNVHIAITSLLDLAPAGLRRGLRIFATLVGIVARAGLLWAAASAWRAADRWLAPSWTATDVGSIPGSGLRSARRGGSRTGRGGAGW